MNRATYVGEKIEENELFLSFGMTGDVELRDEHATYKYTFYPDGVNTQYYLKPEDLHFAITSSL